MHLEHYNQNPKTERPTPALFHSKHMQKISAPWNRAKFHITFVLFLPPFLQSNLRENMKKRKLALGFPNAQKDSKKHMGSAKQQPSRWGSQTGKGKVTGRPIWFECVRGEVLDSCPYVSGSDVHLVQYTKSTLVSPKHAVWIGYAWWVPGGYNFYWAREDRFLVDSMALLSRLSPCDATP